MARGFLNWDRRDFQKFLSSLEHYPREDIAGIATHINTKTEAEVAEYQQAFYANVNSLNDSVKIQENLDRCHNIHSFKKSAPLLIKTKVTAVERPLDEMVLNPIQKSKYFSKEADIVLLCLTHEHGYGNWVDIKHAIRRDGRVRFDHLLMSRNENELQKRVGILVKTIEKEIEHELKEKSKPAKIPSEANGGMEDVEMATSKLDEEQNSGEGEDYDQDDEMK